MPSDGVHSLAFSPDETQIAGGGIGSVLLWSVETGQVKKFPDSSSCAEHIRFAADGKSITTVRGITATAGPAEEYLSVYPSVSKWDVAEARTSVGLIGQKPAAEEAKEEPAGKTDQERIVGNWLIMNDDSKRKGEAWVISEDRILMNPKFGGAIAHLYFHRLDAAKDPKQIDITVTKVNGPPIGIIKGIYALDGDELRLCLADMGKDRPAKFPEKPGPGEVLILHRAKPGAEQPKAKGGRQTPRRC